MSIKSALAMPLSRYIRSRIQHNAHHALSHQQAILRYLLRNATTTRFGKEHHFSSVNQHKEFTQAVPIRDYEAFKPWIEEIKQGATHILWPGRPMYFAKTSGTTSGVKYIPITRESMPFHIQAARNALFCYMAETGNNGFVNGKMIFLSGSPEMETVHGIRTGRLSGIVNHHVPAYLTKNRLPSYATNCIEDWETKLDAIVEETIHQDMRLISGIPPWMQMYFDRLMSKSGKSIGELFPSFSLLVHGGVNFEPYKTKLFESIGRKIDTIETFPASEGFFAYQDSQAEEGLLLNTKAGMYFEFVPVEEIFKEEPKRLSLAEVETGKQYALLVSSNAGLWAYNIGDTIRFVHLNPYRIVVSGRIKHFISAFGEHVIAEETEQAMQCCCLKFGVKTIEYTVAPYIRVNNDNSYHEWFVEFEHMPSDLAAFEEALDHEMRQRNIYYDDLIRGHILTPLKIQCLQRDAFIRYMKGIGKLGGQNKVPRLSNDRTIADQLQAYKL